MSTAIVPEFEIVCGLEVHVELGTQSKLFCGCSTAFGGEPNTQTCPICLAMPGTLPVLNRQAVEYAVMAGLALNCQINQQTKFDRKQYFYPDLPKGYQTSQFDQPICGPGWLQIETAAGPRRIGITRIHLEEDAGKLVHLDGSGGGGSLGGSAVDLNRGGVSLIEIVSEPDIRSADEARAYLESLRSIIVYSGISEAKLQEGQMRCDVNISVRPVGSTELRTRVELKNLSSFKSVTRGIEYESRRQWEAYARGEAVVQETRNFDEERGTTSSMRGKEEAADYRYLPDPDVPPVVLSSEEIAELRTRLPELPQARVNRYVEAYALSAYDASVLVLSQAVSNFFDTAIGQYSDGKTGPELFAAAKAVANWIVNDLLGLLNERNLEIGQTPLTPEHLVGMLRLMDKGTITGKIAKEHIFKGMVETGKTAETIVREAGLEQVSDGDELAQIARDLVAANPKVVADWQGGKVAAAQFLVGQIMKATRGRANPQVAIQVIRQQLAAVTGINNE